MALNGINLPLAFTGQEYVWHKVWKYFGLSEDQMDFTGPAFLAWGRMGNIASWANPLPSDWRESQRDLGRQILAMTRAYVQLLRSYVNDPHTHTHADTA